MSHVALRCTLPLAVVLVFASVVLSIGAEENGRSYRSTPDGTGALTEEMIGNCITLKGKIEQSKTEFTSLEAQFITVAKEAAELRAYFAAVEQEKKFDIADSAEVAAYKERNKAYNEKIAVEKRLHEEMQLKKTVYDQQTATFDRECKGQLYYDDDYAAAVKAKGRGL